MNVNQIMQAVSVIEKVADAFSGIPENQKECVEASLQCRLASIYLAELAKHLQDGMELYDACIATAQGEMSLSDAGVSDSKITVIQLLAHKGAKE